ncbi:hypothetical protein QBC35DRAFT_141227 [Podospora australis]|uniref:Uncharacterized protein n=1 Tax=Podospora australis TaxID=1536484 RepID=A0AAN6WZP8_9PEZI|nr:hypothetical protein QBC35DRAFT_141227 [Podospora australis]
MSSTETFTITAGPNTDLWRKPPVKDISNAPTAKATTSPLPSFRSARISFKLPYTHQYDQAGLLLIFSPLPPSSSSSTPSPSSYSSKVTGNPKKWIKAGLEFYNSLPRFSIVSCDAWADWSVAPLSEPDSSWTSLSIEKEGDEKGESLWVYQILNSGEKIPLREICWVYGDSPDQWEVKVEAMAARPTTDEGAGDLVAEFKDFEVSWE